MRLSLAASNVYVPRSENESTNPKSAKVEEATSKQSRSDQAATLSGNAQVSKTSSGSDKELKGRNLSQFSDECGDFGERCLTSYFALGSSHYMNAQVDAKVGVITSDKDLPKAKAHKKLKGIIPASEHTRCDPQWRKLLPCPPPSPKITKP